MLLLPMIPYCWITIWIGCCKLNVAFYADGVAVGAGAKITGTGTSIGAAGAGTTGDETAGAVDGTTTVALTGAVCFFTG